MIIKKKLIVRPKTKGRHIISSFTPPAIVGPRPRLSVCITCLNDNDELNPTIQSLLDTASGPVEIVVVDDFSDIPATVDNKSVKLHRNPQRIGVAASRDMAAQISTGDFILLTDSHMRFDKGWYESTMSRIGDPKTAWCGRCLGLSEENMRITDQTGSYYGARLILCEKDAAENRFRVFEGKWITEIPGQDDYEISCMMGACYFIHRDTYLGIGGLGALKMWGTDEPYISLKLLMAGVDIRLAKTIRIGHKFRSQSTYKTQTWFLRYNILRSIKELLGDQAYKKLREKLPQDQFTRRAILELHRDSALVSQDRERNGKVFTRGVDWVCDRFNIVNPLHANANPAIGVQSRAAQS